MRLRRTILLLSMVLCLPCFAEKTLPTNTATILAVGPFVDNADGVTPETGMTVTNITCELFSESDAGSAPTRTAITLAASGSTNDMVHITSDVAGFYSVELTAAQLNFLGRATLVFTDSDVCLPVFMQLHVVPAQVYNSFTAGTDLIDANASQLGGTSQTGRDIGASVLLSPGTGTGQIALTSGAVDNVTLVATTTTNTDMRGTDSAATATNLATAQSDLDTLTGTDGVTLATSQPNYAPATATALGTAQTDLDTITGSDGVTLATAQGNYAPAVAGDEMDLVDAPNATAVGVIQSGLSTYAGGDTSGTTSLLSRLTATRAGYLDNLSAGAVALETTSQSVLTDTGTTIPASLAALNDFDPAADTVAHVTLVDTTTTNTDMRGTDSAYTGTPPTAVQVRQEIDSNSTQLTNIVADTNELQTDDVPGLLASLDTKIGTPTDTDMSTDLVNLQAAVDGLNDFDGAWPAAWDAEVQSEVDDALRALYLDSLFASAYTPASKPGNASGLLNVLVENDGGVPRLTANALELGPSGGSAPTVPQIVAGILEEPWADHDAAGNVAEAIGAAGAAADPLSSDGSGYTEGQIGWSIFTYLDQKVSQAGRGAGTVIVTENYGGTNNLQITDDDTGNPVDHAIVQAFLKSEYDTNPTTAEVRGECLSDNTGGWTLHLDPGVYYIVWYKSNIYAATQSSAVTVTE